MATKNEISPFALGVGANVLSPDDWIAAATRQLGFQAGVANSAQANTIWRQLAFVAAMIAQFTADNTPADVLDDGDLATFEGNFKTAILRLAQRPDTPLRPYLLAANSMSVVTPPDYPQTGDTYIVPAAATDDWEDQDHSVAQWTGLDWIFVDFPVGSVIPVTDTLDIAQRTADGWRSAFATLAEAAEGTSKTLLVNPADLVSVASSYGITVTASSEPPAAPKLGDLWIDTDIDVTYSRITDGVQALWIETTL
jgi:hypothetical protein